MGKITQLAKETALKYGYHVPMLFAHGSTGKRYTVLKEFPGEHEAKLAYLFKLGAFVKHEDPVGQLETVFFITEGWMVRLSESEAKAGAIPRPSQDPRRVEVLLVSRFDVASKHLETRILDYVRDERGALVEIKESEVDQPDRVKSPLPAAFATGYAME